MRAFRSSSIILMSAAALSGCVDRDPTGLREYGEAPQFVTVGQYGSFTRLQPANQPALTPNFGLQFQAVWPAATGKVFISRGDDFWMQVDESFTSATVVSSHQDLYTVGSAVQLGGWGTGLNDFWGAHEDGQLFRYDGSWSVVSATGNMLHDFLNLWGFGSSDIWAVGGDRTGGTFVAAAAHYDGNSWTASALPPAAALLHGVWGASSNDVWAVGEATGTPGQAATILHWTGTGWSSVTAPVGPSFLEDVHGSSATNIWAVGSTPNAPLVVHYDGNSWQQMPAPVGAGHLHAVQVLGPNNVYAAGRGLYHWNGSYWTKINDPALKNPNTGGDLLLWDLRIGHGRLYAISPFGDLVIGQTTASHTLTVTVEGSVLQDVAVTIANVDNGAFYVECTDANGVATFSVPAGNYLLHARNFFICNPNALTIWPNGDNFFAPESPNRLAGRTNAIWLNGQSQTLNTTNYLAAVADPIVLGGGATALTLALQTSGAVIDCTLVDGNGDPYTLADNEMIYTVTPFDPADEPNLPPRWPGLPDLPRGIGMATSALPAGDQSTCSMDGLPAGEYVIETTAVTADENEDPVVYREAVTVTEQEAQSGETVEVTMSPEPRRAGTGYLFDVLGDASGPTDLGQLITYGWSADEEGAPTDEFVVTAAFRQSGVGGAAVLTLEIVYDETTLAIPVRCVPTPSAAGFNCAIQGPAPAGVSVTGSSNRIRGAISGKVTWRVILPDVDDLHFRIYSRNGNSPFPADRVPDASHQPASKNDGSGNSFVIMAD